MLNDVVIKASPCGMSVQTQSNPILHTVGKITCT